MTLEEKALYHQIHPLKLAADWGSTPLALYFLWKHRLGPGLMVLLLPPVLASFWVMRFSDLEPYKRSRFGQYVRSYMTRSMQALRLLGALVTVFGAWSHRAWMMPLGLLLVLLAWLRGVLFP